MTAIFGDSRDFKWNNYISRYHTRHCDLMDLLALYQPRASVPLDDMAKLCGFPGKLGMDGSKVWDAYHAGRLKDIRDYCETDAANTYLMYMRFRMMSGALDATNTKSKSNASNTIWPYKPKKNNTGRSSSLLGVKPGRLNS